jgi:hypothetical protein
VLGAIISRRAAESGSVQVGSGLVQVGSGLVQDGSRSVQDGSGSVRVGSGSVQADGGRCKNCEDRNRDALQILRGFGAVETNFEEIRRARRVLLEIA